MQSSQHDPSQHDAQRPRTPLLTSGHRGRRRARRPDGRPEPAAGRRRPVERRRRRCLRPRPGRDRCARQGARQLRQGRRAGLGARRRLAGRPDDRHRARASRSATSRRCASSTRGSTADDLAQALISGAAKATGAVGAAGGALAAVEFAAPPTLLTAPVQLAAETLLVAAIEVKLLAELHEVYEVSRERHDPPADAGPPDGLDRAARHRPLRARGAAASHWAPRRSGRCATG